MLGNGVCEKKCLTDACANDREDCESETCSMGCYLYMVGKASVRAAIMCRHVSGTGQTVTVLRAVIPF